MSKRQEMQKGAQIRDELRETPCRDASELSEEYGVSPATVGRVVQNLDEDLNKMRQLRMKKHVDDLYDVERDVLWIVAHQPAASQAEVKTAYEEHADIEGMQSAHPETGDDAPITIGDLWHDVFDSDWQGRTALANDLQDLLDEDCVSAAAEQAVTALEEGDVEVVDNSGSEEAQEGTRLYLMHEIADAVGDEEGAEAHLQKRRGKLGEEATRSVADELGVRGAEDKKLRELRKGVAKELGYEPDEVATGINGKLRKGCIESIHEAIVEDEPDHECDVCGKEFDSPRALGGHKPCPERDDDLSRRQRDILEAVQDDPDAYQYEIAERVGTTQGQVSQAFHRLPYDWGEREQAAEDLLDQEDVDDSQAEEESQATEDDELSEIAERQLAIALEHPDVSARQVFHAEYVDRHGRQPGHDATMAKDLEDAHVENFREVAEEYFETHEKPDVSDVDVEETGIDLDEMLEDVSEDDDEATEMVREFYEEDDQGESDDVEMQETPTDRDIEQADGAAEEIADDIDVDTPLVKNDVLGEAIDVLRQARERGLSAEAVEVYREDETVKFDAEGVVLDGGEA